GGGFVGERFDAGAKNLHVERASIKRKADRRPGEAGDERHLKPHVVGYAQVRSKCEIKKVELDQRRGVAKELHIGCCDGARETQGRSLYPGARYANHDTCDEAECPQPEPRQRPLYVT